jgi:hypothetical protein
VKLVKRECKNKKNTNCWKCSKATRPTGLKPKCTSEEISVKENNAWKCKKCGKGKKIATKDGKKYCKKTDNSVRPTGLKPKCTSDEILKKKNNAWKCKKCGKGKKIAMKDGKKYCKKTGGNGNSGSNNGSPRLCPYVGVQPRPSATFDVQNQNYKEWTFEKFTKYACGYTYWIENASSAKEYHYLIDQFTWLSSHYHHWHAQEELYGCPHLTKWEANYGHPAPEPVDEGLVCLSKSSKAYKKMIAQGV